MDLKWEGYNSNEVEVFVVLEERKLCGGFEGSSWQVTFETDVM